MTSSDTPQALAEGVIAGDRRALARAITRVESANPAHRADADALLTALLPHAGKSLRLGISGVPGVGKSTFIESFGLHLISLGLKIAVLAVDPSSPRTKGSILGDKTRMERLSQEQAAFIRPSPSGGALGGVARRTREALLVCEAAGFDVVIVETVGVGQSETAVADMVDLFTLLLVPGGGDELQGIKKGIVELADLIVVNKADGAFVDAAKRAARDYENALHLLRPASTHWQPRVHQVSALTSAGLETVWASITDFRTAMTAAGEWQARREKQALAWMWTDVREDLMAALTAHPDVSAALPALEADVTGGRTTPGAAARELLRLFRT